jgi:lysosomal alpha-mannosidase
MIATLFINNILLFFITQFFQVKNFVLFVEAQARHYTSNNIILTMGDDFAYQDAGMYFKNLDKLIK